MTKNQDNKSDLFNDNKNKVSRLFNMIGLPIQYREEFVSPFKLSEAIASEKLKNAVDYYFHILNKALNEKHFYLYDDARDFNEKTGKAPIYFLIFGKAMLDAKSMDDAGCENTGLQPVKKEVDKSYLN